MSNLIFAYKIEYRLDWVLFARVETQEGEWGGERENRYEKILKFVSSIYVSIMYFLQISQNMRLKKFFYQNTMGKRSGKENHSTKLLLSICSGFSTQNYYFHTTINIGGKSDKNEKPFGLELGYYLIFSAFYFSSLPFPTLTFPRDSSTCAH